MDSGLAASRPPGMTASDDSGDSVSRRDLDVYRARRANELRDGLNLDDERNLRAAGIEPQEYREADGARRDELLQRAGAALRVERDLLDVIGEPGIGISAQSMRQARQWLDPDELRRRTAEHLARLTPRFQHRPNLLIRYCDLARRSDFEELLRPFQDVPGPVGAVAPPLPS